jgi:tetratricopeptide (TPR) repeat protein
VQIAINRVTAQIGLQQFPAAHRLQRELQRRFSGSYYAEWGSAVIDWAEGGIDSLPGAAERLRRSKLALSRAVGASMSAADVGARGQLRLFADRLTTARAVWDSASGNGDPLRYALFGVVPTTVHRRTEAAGVATLDSLRTRFPQSGRPAVDRQDLAIAIAYAQLGRAEKAKPLITEWARAATGPERLVRWAEWRAALGEVALAEGRPAEALQEFRAAADADSGALEPATTGQTDARMARAFDKAGQPDSALVRFERVARVRNVGGYLRAPLNLPIAYRRLGELYEARGNTPKSLENYRAFVKLWANADAELRPQVSEVNRRIDALLAADARKR